MPGFLFLFLMRSQRRRSLCIDRHEAYVSSQLSEKILQGTACRNEHLPQATSHRSEYSEGHVYYRCQTMGCPTKTLREETIDGTVKEKLAPLQLQKRELEYLQTKFAHLDQHWLQKRQNVVSALELQIANRKSD